MSAPRCKRHGCGRVMRHTIGPVGELGWTCDACARNKRGRCRDCPRPLANRRALRCPPCARRHYLERQKEKSRAITHDPERRAKRRERQRRHESRPDVKARTRERRRAWLKKNPGYQAFATRKWRHTPEGRERSNAWRRRWWWQHHERELARQRADKAKRRAKQERAA